VNLNKIIAINSLCNDFFILYVLDSTNDACTKFPCDVNSQGCLLVSGSNTNSAADRMCLPCRSGFMADGSLCIDAQLLQISMENVGAGNAAWFASKVTTSLTVNRQNSAGLALVIQFASTLSQVCFY
jgi:hypothetical protein